MPPATPTESTLADGADRRAARWLPVYESLRRSIIGHQLSPGRKLPEDELSSIFEVGRSAVRAALQALAHDGLVTLEPNRGAFIAQPSPREAREVFEARALIEPKVAAMAAARVDRGGIRALRTHLELERKALRAGQDGEAIMLSAKFHVEIARIADQHVFIELVRDLVSRSSLIIALYWERRETTCEQHAHEALVDALARGDGRAAARLMARHLDDLLSGLDLTASDAETETLASILK